MKIRTVIGLAGATAASLVGVAGLAASPAGAGGNGAVNMPAANLTGFLAANYGSPFAGVPIFATPFMNPETQQVFPNTKVSGNCDAAPWLWSDLLGLNFTSGNAVAYKPNSTAGLSIPNLPPVFPGGLNAEGTAHLIDLGTDGLGTTDTGFVGSAHIWMGENANANGQYVAAQTVSFSGTDPTTGSTISFSVNPGEDHSPSGHNGGWGQQNLSCNIVPSAG